MPEQYKNWFGQQTKLILLLPDETVLSDPERGQKMAEALSRIAAHGGTGISDPVVWQHEIRHDRALPDKAK